MKTASAKLTVCALVSAIAAVSSGCGVVSSKSCTAELRSYGIELTREIDIDPSAATSLDVQACVRGGCASAKPKSDGTIDFGRAFGEFGARQGSAIAGTGTAKTRVTVTFQVAEGEADGTTPLTLRVLDATGKSLHDSSANVEWTDDECHPAPKSTTL